MKRLLLAIVLLSYTLTLQAADYLDTSKVLLEIKGPLTAAFNAAQEQAGKTAESPLSKILDMKDLVLPLLGGMLNVDLTSESSTTSNANTSNSSASAHMVDKILESKALNALLSSENIITRSSNSILYAVRSNFCAAAREDSTLSDTHGSLCDTIVGMGKLFVEIKKDNGITFSSLWEEKPLARLSITPNSLSHNLYLDNVFILKQFVVPDTSVNHLSGRLGLDINFTSGSTAATCKNQAQSCLAFKAEKVSLKTSSGLNFFLDGDKETNDLLALEFQSNGATKLHLNLASLKLSLALFEIDADINNLITTISLEKDKAIFENTSKGEGHIDFASKRFKVDINEGRSIPQFTFMKDSLHIPSSVLQFTVSDVTKSLIEILKFTAVTDSALILSADDKTNASSNTECDKPLTMFHESNAFYLLNDLLNSTISKTPTKDSMGVTQGEVEITYEYGSKKDDEEADWFGIIKFLMSAGEYLNKTSTSN